MKCSIYVKDVLQCICMANLIVMNIWNLLHDLIFVRHAIKIIEEMISFVHFKDL